MEPGRVSVVMTCYRGEEWIEGSVRSVLDQNYPHLEILVVNDASPDRSADILERMAAKDSRIRILTNPENRGIPASRNRGLREMTGEYFCILDQDDLWCPERAARQVAFLSSRPESMAAYCRTRRVDPEGVLLEVRPLPSPSTGRLFEAFLTSGTAVPLLSLMFRSRLLDQIGPFDERLKGHDDFEFLLRASHCTRFDLVPETLVKQRYRPGSYGQSESMAFDQLHLARVLEEKWPQYPSLVRAYRARAHYNLAHYLAGRDRWAEAGGHFLASARSRPGFLKAWWFWISLHLPETVRRRLPRRLRLSREKYNTNG